METIKIQTAQNIEIEYEIAGLGDRLVAAIIDYVVLISFVVAYFWLIDLFNLSYNNFIATVFYWILVLIWVFYHLLSEIFFDGKSIGKSVFKMKVVNLDGTSPTIASYLLRWMFRFLDLLFLGVVGLITIILNGKGQRIGDIAAGTSVISLKIRTTFEDTLFKEVEDTYKMHYPEVEILGDKEMDIIQKILNAARKNESSEVMNKLSKKVEDILKIKRRHPPTVFIETVIKDYNYLHNQYEI